MGCGELTGYSHKDLLAQKPNFETLIYPEYREMVTKAVEKAMKTKTTYTLSYPIRTANDEKKWVFEKGKVIWGEDDKAMYLTGFITSSNQVVHRERAELTDRNELQNMALRKALAWTFII